MTINLGKIEAKILSSDDDLTAFVCGKKPIDDFIHNEAIDFQEQRLGVSYVFRYQGKVIGFLTLSMADLKKEKMKDTDKLKVGKENYPALQVSQLAVCKDEWGKGIGTYLCDYSCAKAYQFSKKVGCRFLVLNAKDEVIGFYEKYGFKLIPNQKTRKQPLMFLNIFSKYYIDV